MTIIKSVNLGKTFYNDTNSISAIKDCNIEIKKGEFVVISGSKASGKTTLLRLLGGYERPSEGAVYISDNNITLYDDDELAILRKKEVGYLFQNDSLIPELTVHENIIMPMVLGRKRCDEDYYKDLSDRLHISGILSRYPKQLTANQLQCVAYARALIHKPNIILMDEPLNYLYHHMDMEVFDYLLDAVYQYHKTLIIVTNNSDISFYADHVIKLRKGSVIEDKYTS